jgi:hypothetical protein
MTTFACPRCQHTSTQPLATAMWHTCRPPGRPAKVTQLIAVDNDGETQKPTRSTQKP